MIDCRRSRSNDCARAIADEAGDRRVPLDARLAEHVPIHLDIDGDDMPDRVDAIGKGPVVERQPRDDLTEAVRDGHLLLA